MLVNFKEYNLKKIDYEITIVNDFEYYSEYQEETFVKNFYSEIQRKDIDFFHQSILKAHSNKINPNAEKFTINNFLPIVLEKIDTTTKSRFKNPTIFMHFIFALSASYMVNAVFVISSVCEERKKKSFDFLKLMGATDGEIYFGHFLNHFLVWMPSFIYSIIYFNGFVEKTFNLIFILIIISLLYFVHLIVFVLMLSAPFKKDAYPEILYILIFFVSFNNLMELSNQNSFLEILQISSPMIMLKKFYEIGTYSLSPEFNFKNETLYSLFTYSTANQLSLLSLILFDLFFILIEISFTNYIIQVNPFQNGTPKGPFYFLEPKYWLKTTPLINYEAPNCKEIQPVPSNNRPAIILKNIDKSYRTWFVFGKFQVLKNFNFAIYEKQITVLLGHNGAGKIKFRFYYYFY